MNADPPPIVGRDVELGVLSGLVDQAAAGDGGFLLVTGEAGIGKTTLLAVLFEAGGRRGLTVLSGRAIEGGGGAYRPIIQALMDPLRSRIVRDSDDLRPFRSALGRLLPGWSAEAPAETVLDPTLLLGEGVLRLLRTVCEDGVVVVLEDLHWSDADTVALVEYLAGVVAGSSVLLAASSRDDAPVASRLRRQATMPGGTLIALDRLDAAQTAGFIDRRHPRLSPVARQQVIERSDGVPFLIDELLRAVSSADSATDASDDVVVPDSFAELVEARLDTLSAPERRVLSGAAVLGDEPDWSLLAPTTGLDGEVVRTALRAAVRAQLLVAGPGRLAWRHALTRHAVLRTLMPPDHRELARSAATALLSTGTDEATAASIDLLEAAGDSATVTTVLLSQAERETSRGALRSAEERLSRAYGTGRQKAAVALARVRLYTLTGHAVRALEVGGAALDEAAGEAHADLCFALARAAVVASRWEEATSYLVRAGRADQPLALILAANVANGTGRVGEAVQLANRAVVQSEASAEDPALLCEALCVVGRLARLTDAATAVAAFRRAAQVAAEAGLKPWRVEALLGLRTVEMLEVEQPAGLAEVRDLALESGLLIQAASADIVLTEQVFVLHGPRALVEPAHRLVELAELLQLPGVQALAEILLAMSEANPGNEPAMEAWLTRVAQRPDLAPDTVAQIPTVRAMAATLAHDLPRALALLDEFAAPLIEYASAAPLHQFGLWALLRTILRGPGDEARAIVRSLPAALRQANRGALHFADAVAAGQQGRPADALSAFDAGEAELVQLPWWHRLLRLLTCERALLDGWGDPVPLLRADLAVFEREGDVALSRVCRDLLRSAGATTRRGRGDSVVPPRLRALGVTSRELDVWTLLAQGLSNAEVADRLYLSTRTVETHVSSLLSKTGTATRTELRALLSRLTP